MAKVERKDDIQRYRNGSERPGGRLPPAGTPGLSAHGRGGILYRLRRPTGRHGNHEAERDFNQIVVYGKIPTREPSSTTHKNPPMMGPYEVVIVKEAQSLRKPEQPRSTRLPPRPPPSSSSATRARASTSARSSTSTSCKRAKYSNRYVRATTKSRPGWATSSNRSGCTIEPKALGMLTDHLGTDISRISNELAKLLTFLPEANETNHRAAHRGQHRYQQGFQQLRIDESYFEKNMARAMLIADHFRRNPKRQSADGDIERPVHPFPAHLHRQLQTVGDSSQKRSGPSWTPN